MNPAASKFMEGHSPRRTFPKYFTELATNYTLSTGNSTAKVIAKYLAQNPSLLDTSSIINDDACGPAIAAAAVIAHLGHEPNRIDANDNVPAMVEAAEARIKGQGWQHVHAAVIDSHKLPYTDKTFTVSISNISAFTFTDALVCFKEMHRTLQPNGTLVVTVWKRFGAAEIIHAAQKKVRADSEPMKVPRTEFMHDGFVAEMVRATGFIDVKQEVVSVICEGDEIDGLRGFMLSDFTRSAKEGWNDQEIASWPAAVNEAVKEEVSREGGVKFEAWAVTGKRQSDL
ncbi:S-adenosyl-L-methionine-dependent methyltransferase [Eremomyces bilateralis CBS 781.70]|uniref:S-adenosyl-L-methionine-dependent methyltransferase n=1 Tax=Eremomyces bilateralis CBS 781.70 TaxID=1392243 RepID=A0A6G1FQ89_9PEZI|nr:S-adenosyl-L-methionine-dependent methyltransferase [Eremomyces bilateralis CBS 781.70]KAF1807870.1 S-adenosyl-L-methionine-dependent methyltransferase [Eremomyces bilateralis CBS 781.70]